jgi:ferrous iron transport protein B
MFLRDAGTVILVISITIWALSTYPKLSDADFQAGLRAGDATATEFSPNEAHQRMRADQEFSVIGRAGKLVEPIFRPLGFDWKTSVGVLTSFAAREVIVSTMSVLYGLGDDPDEESSLHARLSAATREDGTRVFDTATCVSLLVFFVLAMQCLPTQAVTRRETGSWKWAFFQLIYMTGLAYVAAFVARHIVLVLGG